MFILLQTMLIMSWSSLCLSLCVVKHAESLDIQRTHAPHEGFLHRFLTALSFQSQSLNLCLGLLYSLTVLAETGSRGKAESPDRIQHPMFS